MKISTGWNPGTSWKRLPGHPRKTGTFHILDDAGMSPCSYWDASICHGHGRGTLAISEDYALMMTRKVLSRTFVL